jgi:uncharacterized protein with PIN domain
MPIGLGCKITHLAGLNFGDCFAYKIAMEQACPLLYVGGDFAQTGVISAIKFWRRRNFAQNHI